MAEKLLEVKNLEVNFKTDCGEVKAIRNVSFDLYDGEILAIVGESGCGKSMLCRSLIKLLPNNGYIRNGEILLNNYDLVKIKEKNISKIRGKDISMIFQDPMTSLNPTICVGKQIAEVVKIHNKTSKSEAKKKAIELMELVGIEDAVNRYNQYPYQFSSIVKPDQI